MSKLEDLKKQLAGLDKEWPTEDLLRDEQKKLVADVQWLISRVERYEKALNYIKDHDWVLAKEISIEHWVDVFIEMAEKALAEDKE